MNLNFAEALHCSNIFYQYFGKFERIDDYMRDQKIQSLENLSSNPLFDVSDEIFSDFAMNPEDMDLDLVECNDNTWNTLLNITSSHINIPPVGRNLKMAIKEKITNKYVGFIRLSSPMINCSPRNKLLDSVFSQKKELSDRFNNSAIMGFVIVPTQPFGFNYLGGKLLAALCCSHEVRQKINEKYNMNTCLFETTSLYGSTKTISQYEGMKPFLRFKGLTDSDFIPMMHGKIYEDLVEYVEIRTGKLLMDGVSSRKHKIITKIISLVRKSLKNTKELANFEKTIDNAKKLTQQKRYYVSNYGFKNYIDYINCRTDKLIKDENFDSFYKENIISWWKTKSQKRYEILKSENRIRNEIEVWTNQKHIDIIR